ncbi:flagella biosynthesis chaperone for FliD, FliT [Shewanella gaetbuli]|uniref:Flagella biosynthesis chaperone for FliD, FliT n=1 Tax=Shewanella gaetbuli TaxID=220752 RepID=A0A9X2CKJ4_9GAMM|nr:flagella biosynthesis chaperone for FliD, FliT [Shewanella gaetbuli]MCL1141694.1 flagella biosynthesis chaperone for FliD, FliT [Shewanella gaetbuli]
MSSQLEQINISLFNLLKELDELPADAQAADELVLLLHTQMEERQTLVNELLVKPVYDGLASELSKQIDLTNSLSVMSTKVMNKRKELLNKRRSNKKKINVYEYIDSNR